MVEIDVNGDGDVTLEEFSELMESHMYLSGRPWPLSTTSLIPFACA
jgi:hypothetical protein